MELLLKFWDHFNGSSLKRTRKNPNKTTDIDLDHLSSYPGKLVMVQTKEGRENNSNSTIAQENTREHNTNVAVEWRLTREDVIYNLKMLKFGIWLMIFPVEFDEVSGRIWLPAESCKWKGRVGNAWIGFVGTRIISIIIAVIYTIGIKEREGEFELYQQMLDTVITFVVILIFIAYCSVVVQNLPSQTILSNQIYHQIGKGK